MNTSRPACPRLLPGLLALGLLLSLTGCFGPSIEELPFEMPGGGQLITRIEPLDGREGHENIYTYVPPGEGAPEEVARSIGEPDRLVHVGPENLGDTAESGEQRPSELIVAGDLLVFRPRLQESETSERIFVRTGPGNWIEHRLEDAYLDTKELDEDTKPIDSKLTPPTVVDIDMDRLEIIAWARWGYQLRALRFKFDAEVGALKLTHIHRVLGTQDERDAFSARGAEWELAEIQSRAKRVFAAAKERQVLGQAQMTTEGAQVGNFVTIDFLNELFSHQRNMKAFVLQDVRIIAARDCVDDEHDQFRAYYAYNLVDWEFATDPFAEIWRYVLDGGEWRAADIELFDPTLEAIEAIMAADVPDPEADCIQLR